MFCASPILPRIEMIMSERQANNPLHGITLKQIVNSLVEDYGWTKLGLL